jgi:hypothetical protein
VQRTLAWLGTALGVALLAVRGVGTTRVAAIPAAAPASEDRSCASGSGGSKNTRGVDEGLGARFPRSEWALVDAAEVSGTDCHLYAARHADALKPLVWLPRGRVHEVAELAGDGPAEVIASAASTRGGTAYGFWSRPTGHGRDYVSQVVRLEDGVTVAALGVAHGGEVCADSYESSTALSLFHLAGTEADTRVLYITLGPANTWNWTERAMKAASSPRGLVEFDADTRIFSVGKNGVRMLAPPLSNWTLVDPSPTASFGAGAGDMAVWLESESPRLRAWVAGEEGPRTLLERPPPRTCLVAVGSAAVVGLATDDCLGQSSGFRFWQLATSGSNALRVGPRIAASLFLPSPYAIRTHGDYVVIQSGAGTEKRTERSFFVVTRISTWQSWRIDALAPLVAQETTWSLDDAYLYWAEADADATYHRIRRMVRLPLAALNDFGTSVRD